MRRKKMIKLSGLEKLEQPVEFRKKGKKFKEKIVNWSDHMNAFR